MTMDSLAVYLVTFNCARTLIDVDRFASHFFTHRNSSAPPPDLIVLSLQELAPIAHSFLGGSLLVPYFRRFVQAVNKATIDEYESIAVRNVGLTAIMVFARRSLTPHMRPHSYAGVGVGQWEMGNKGAVGVRLAVGDDNQAQLTFVSAHLAPMEDAVLRRNQDWKDIVAGLVFTSTPSDLGGKQGSEAEPLLAADRGNAPAARESTMFKAHVPVFFAGDLNYRTSDIGPSADGHRDFPQPSQSADFRAWRDKDQLTRERLGRSTLQHLDELPVHFPPTYKYNPDKNMPWPEDGAEPSEYAWAKHRYPSWCDRILFSSQLTQSQPSPFEADDYSALPLESTSDHRPVALSLRLDLRPFFQGQDAIQDVSVVAQKNHQWATHRASARRLEIIIGSVAYLTLTREGNFLLIASVIGAVGGWLLLRSVIE